jgi:hypothetical protein
VQSTLPYNFPTAAAVRFVVRASRPPPWKSCLLSLLETTSRDGS